MNENGDQTNGASGEDQGQTGAGASGSGGDGGTQAPAGYVPQGELDRVQQTARGLQSERDRLRSELTRLQQAAASSGNGDGGSNGEFDPEAFRRSLMTDVLGVTALTTAVPTIRTEFPHADPSLFSDRLAEFRSPEALRAAAEASHARVAAALDAERASIEEKLRAEFVERYGQGAAGNGGTNAQGQPGDPTAAQLAAMTVDELTEVEAKNPGVIDRVLRSAS